MNDLSRYFRPGESAGDVFLRGVQEATANADPKDFVIPANNAMRFLASHFDFMFDGVLEALIRRGLLTIEGDCLDWQESQGNFAYLLGRMSPPGFRVPWKELIDHVLFQGRSGIPKSLSTMYSRTTEPAFFRGVLIPLIEGAGITVPYKDID